MIRTRCMLLGRFVLATVGLAAIAAQAACAADPNSAAQPAEKKYTAIAYLLVARQEPRILPREGDKETTAEFECFRSTQMQLIKSRYVIIAALRNAKLKSSPSIEREDAKHHSVEWLSDAIQVRCPDERTGVLTVSLTANDAQEAANLVNAVMGAYFEEVVGRDRWVRRERLDVLQRICAEKEAEVRTKKELLKRELELIGGSTTPGASLEKQLLTEHALFCQHKLDELRDSQHQIEADVAKQKAVGHDPAKNESQLAELTDQIRVYEKDLERTKTRAEGQEQTSIASAMAADELRITECILHRLMQEREVLRVELNAGPRVMVLGDATAPAAVPECPD